MGENIRLFISEQIEPRARRQERKTGFRQAKPALTHQKRLQPRPQRMQIQHVRRGISELLGRELGSSPIGGLLLLGYLHAENFAAQVAATHGGR